MKSFAPLLISSILLGLLTGSLYAHGVKHKCVHDQMKIQRVYGMQQEVQLQNHRILADWAPIRVKADYSNLKGLDASRASFVQNILVPAAISWVEKTYKVKQFTTGLKAPEGETTCMNLNLPATVTGGNSLSNTDLLLVVGFATEPQSSWVARAGGCAHDALSGRPYIGMVEFNTAFLKDAETEWIGNLGTTLHEIHHILFFSSDLYADYIDPTTNNKLKNVSGKVTIDGMKTRVFYHPKIVAAARAYFNCSSISYVRLENEGSSGSAGSHWERRWFGNEFITASGGDREPVSNLTLVLAEVSGWYLPNYQMADPLYWGKNRGCPFLTQPCLTGKPVKAISQEFCDRPDAEGCDLEFTGASSCSVSEGDIKNSKWDYFRNGTTSIDEFSDNCPTQFTFSNRICGPGGEAGGLSPEYFGKDSACFVSSIVSKSYVASTQGQCYQYKCSPRPNGGYSLEVTIGKEQFNCTTEGQALSTQAKGYRGSLKCPNPNLFCDIKMRSCQKACGGVGTCVNGSCVCPQGRKGPDCLRKT